MGFVGSLMSSFLTIFKQRQTDEAGLGERCTIKSHGSKVAGHHKHDWFILLVLAALEIGLFTMRPFYRFVGEGMMDDLKYPLKDNTVPTWSVGVYAVILPVVIFVIIYIRRRDVYDLHHGILGLLYAVLITGIITDSIKLAVGRPRPDFFWRCFPDGIDKYDKWGNVICHGIDSVIKEGHKSFPSGHASWSFAGLGFLSMYLSGKLQAFNRKGHIAKLCLVFLPLLAASLVGVSRVDDYRHHWEDVFAGGLIGLVAAMFCYLQFFPAPYHSEGWGPYAYFNSVEESRRARAAQSGDSATEQEMEFQTVNPSGATSTHSCADRDHDDSGISLDLLETGRRCRFFVPDKSKFQKLAPDYISRFWICHPFSNYGRNQFRALPLRLPKSACYALLLCVYLLKSSSPIEGVSRSLSHPQPPFFCDSQVKKWQIFHTVKSHGVKVLRFHMHDWLILVLLGVIEIILNVIEPFHRFVGVDMMSDLKYPMKENTIPFWAVPIVAGLLPIIVFIVYYIIKRDLYDLHHGILGILYSLLVTGVITDAIKDGVGRPRPDFFWRCFPDGKVKFDPVTKGVICTGIKSVIKEGHKSFPSGHTSWSFAGLGFFAWYISGKVRAFNQKGHVAKLCLVLLPLLAAALIAISRVDDYWHHWQDVFTGGLIGLTVASFCYLQFFPPPHHANGWGPRAYFQMLSDSQQSRDEPAALGLDTYPNELRTINIHPRNTIYSNSSASSTRDTYPIL